VGQIKFEDYIFYVKEDREGARVQAVYSDLDFTTNKFAEQHTRKWLISPEMTDSEIVRTIFKLCSTSMEHRLRENFLFNGRRVFGPHIHIATLWEHCKEVDVRPTRELD